jgi:hypothetical protein
MVQAYGEWYVQVRAAGAIETALMQRLRLGLRQPPCHIPSLTTAASAGNRA